MTIIGH